MSKSFDPNTESRALCIHKIFENSHDPKKTDDGILELLNDLPDNQINITSKDSNYTLLMRVVSHNFLKCTKKILTSFKNVDVNYISASEENLSALTIASIWPDDKINELLLSHPDIDPNIQTEFGDTSLHIACSFNAINVAKLLLAHPKIDVNIKNNKGNTPLHCSLVNNHSEISNLLIDIKNINVNIQNNNGDTAIMSVFTYNSLKIQESMIDIIKKICSKDKYNNNIRNNEGESFIDILLKRGRFNL